MLDYHELSQVITHSLIVFVLLILLTRLIGKKFLAQMTFFDFMDDLLMQLREQGVFDLSEVESAILEPHG